MKSFPTEAKFILLFFAILTIFTVFSNFNLDSGPANAKSLRNLTNEIVNVKPSLLRTPASIEEESSAILNKEFLCKPAQNIVRDKVNKPMVIISFKMCQESQFIGSIALENESNGFKAHIFKLEKNNFKTDYIQLNNGINKLKFEVVLKDGQKIIESLEILSGS